MDQNISNKKKTTPKANGSKPSVTEHYLEQLQYVPSVQGLIGEKGTFIPGTTKSTSDFSYSASKYSEDHFRIIGDAANFVDPFFSSGVHIGMMGDLSASTSICASMKGQIDEITSQAWYDAKVGIAHTRFLFVVLGAYRQMRLRSVPILGEINADNFDKSFEMLRPVICGLADSQKKLTDKKVNDMMEICRRFFDPLVDEDDVQAVKLRYGVDLIKMQSPILGTAKIEELVKDDKVAERVLKKFDAIKMFSDGHVATEIGRNPLLGYRAHVERGELGLFKVDEIEDEETEIMIAAL